VHQHHRRVEVAGEELWEAVGAEVLAGRGGELTGTADGAGRQELLQVCSDLRQQGRVPLGVEVQAAHSVLPSDRVAGAGRGRRVLVSAVSPFERGHSELNSAC